MCCFLEIDGVSLQQIVCQSDFSETFKTPPELQPIAKFMFSSSDMREINSSPFDLMRASASSIRSDAFRLLHDGCRPP